MSIKASVGLDFNNAIIYMGQSIKVNLDNLSLDFKLYAIINSRKNNLKHSPIIFVY